jgi:hypothetical protein
LFSIAERDNPDEKRQHNNEPDDHPNGVTLLVLGIGFILAKNVRHDLSPLFQFTKSIASMQESEKASTLNQKSLIRIFYSTLPESPSFAAPALSLGFSSCLFLLDPSG